MGPTVMMRVSTLSKAGWPDRWGPHVIDSAKIRKNKKIMENRYNYFLVKILFVRKNCFWENKFIQLLFFGKKSELIGKISFRIKKIWERNVFFG